MEQLVTIAIASFNNGGTIGRCINSVINQSYHNLDILVIDDGSADCSLEVCKGFSKEKRLRVIAKENGGLSSSRQLAIEKALGVYICFIDADDYLLPNHVSNLIERIKQDGSDIGICGTRVEYADGAPIDSATKSLSCKDGVLAVSIEAIGKDKGDCLRPLLLSDSWNKLYSLKFIKESQVTFNMPKGLNGSDTNFNRKLVLHSPTYSLVSEAGYVHIVYPSSAVHRRGKKLINSFVIIVKEQAEEGMKLGVFKQIKEYLSLYVITASRVALSDLFKERESLCSFFGDIKEVERLCSELSSDLSLPRLSINEMPSFSLKLYVFLLRYCVSLLPFYFNLRKG
jgi:glycosyltransferase involved in cell wall biosynthesis